MTTWQRLLDRYFLFCPKSGKFSGFRTPDGVALLLTPFIGMLAVFWIIFRVATKPSRITYPCVRAAMPFASGFLGLATFFALSILMWFKAKKYLAMPAFLFATVFAVVGLCGSYIFADDASLGDPQLATITLPPNEPMGTAIGIFPGRVVWVHRPEATNENCSPRSIGHEWYRAENTNQAIIDTMVSTVIRGLSGTSTDAAAWTAIFQFHNSRRGKGAIGYVPGEKIFIKTNATSSWSGNFNPSDLSTVANSYNGISETSPPIVLSVLRQLVNVAGVVQSDIYVGDPMKHIYKHCYDLWHAEFPNVHYLDVSGYEHLGRERVVKQTTPRLKYSDRGAVLRTYNDTGAPIYNDSLYTVFDQMEYMLNIPMLKGHKRAGVTMFAKNHFGSHVRPGAWHLHNGLVAPDEVHQTRTGYGLYRVQVDLMGHDLLGKKNLFYLLDALWATDYELDIPLKWMMPPFNNDWMSSVLASLDPVAIESVGYDFLRTEFTVTRGAGTYVQMNGVDDYLHQAADSINWPSGIRYDPENDGTVLGSLGTHEHWNDGIEMRYSRNLGTGNGIELVKLNRLTSVLWSESGIAGGFHLFQNYPNPFNPQTAIVFDLARDGTATLDVFDVSGKHLAALVNGRVSAGTHRVEWNASGFASGVYLYRLEAHGTVQMKKMVLAK